MKIEICISDFLRLVKNKDAYISNDDETIKIRLWHYYTINDKKAVFEYTKDDGDMEAFSEMCDICDKLGIIAKIGA